MKISHTAIVADTSQFMCKIPVGARGSSDQAILKGQQCQLRGVRLVKARRPYVRSLIVKCNAASDDVPLFGEVKMIEPLNTSSASSSYSATYKRQTKFVGSHLKFN